MVLAAAARHAALFVDAEYSRRYTSLFIRHVFDNMHVIQVSNRMEQNGTLLQYSFYTSFLHENISIQNLIMANAYFFIV